MFIDWELIERGPPLTSPPFSVAKGEARFDVEAILMSGVKNAFVVASASLLAPFFPLRRSHRVGFALTLIVIVGYKLKALEKTNGANYPAYLRAVGVTLSCRLRC